MLDSWIIKDAHKRWDFRVEIHRDPEETRPDLHADAYNADIMLKENGPESAEWARRAVKAWQEDKWQWACITVRAQDKADGREVSGASVGMCDYGELPSSNMRTTLRTDARDYVRDAWVNDLITEATSMADGAALKAKENEERRLSMITDLIITHTGASLGHALAAATEITRKGLDR